MEASTMITLVLRLLQLPNIPVHCRRFHITLFKAAVVRLSLLNRGVPPGLQCPPFHQPITSSGSIRSSRTSVEQLGASGGGKSKPLSTPSKSPGASSSLYLVPRSVSPLQSTVHSPALDSVVSSPWSGKRASSSREITSKERLEQFLAEVDEKITESAGKMVTPPPTIGGLS